MKQYTIRPDGFREIKKQLLFRAIPLIILALAGGIAMSSLNSKEKEGGVNVLPIVIPIAALAVGVGVYRGVNRQKALFESYTLSFSNNLITREQLNTPPLSIYFNDVQQIVKNKNGSFTIKGRGTTDNIFVPAQVENYEDLEAALNTIMPVTTNAVAPLWQKYSALLPLLTIGLMLCVYTVTNKLVVLVSGTLLTGLLLWSLYTTQRSKNVDRKTKQSMWWVLVVLLSVICVMAFKLSGFTHTP